MFDIACTAYTTHIHMTMYDTYVACIANNKPFIQPTCVGNLALYCICSAYIPYLACYV